MEDMSILDLFHRRFIPPFFCWALVLEIWGILGSFFQIWGKLGKNR